VSFNVVIVGAGRMGKLHARVVSEMPEARLVGVVDANLAAATALARQRDCRGVTDAAELMDQVNAAIIAVPTMHHLSAARPFVQAGKDVLIEKPLANDPAAAAELIALAARTGSRVQVGHTERFNPAVVAMAKYRIVPKFIEASRISPFTFRSADVGVVLDMMIHDLDLLGMLVRQPVTLVQAVGINVIGAHEDICNARLTFEGGCVANLTASRLAVKTERKMRIFSEQTYLSVDYGQRVGMVIQKDANLDLIQMARDLKATDLGELAASMDYTKLLKVEQLVVDDSIEPLRRQAEAFRDTVVHNAPPVVSAADGLAAIELAQRIVESLKHHRWDGPASPREGLDVLRRS